MRVVLEMKGSIYVQILTHAVGAASQPQRVRDCGDAELTLHVVGEPSRWLSVQRLGVEVCFETQMISH